LHWFFDDSRVLYRHPARPLSFVPVLVIASVCFLHSGSPNGRDVAVWHSHVVDAKMRAKARILPSYGDRQTAQFDSFYCSVRERACSFPAADQGNSPLDLCTPKFSQGFSRLFEVELLDQKRKTIAGRAEELP